MRRWLRQRLPGHDAVHGQRWLAPFASVLLHPRIWHLNRHSAAGGVAVGLFCGLIPGPFQMLGAAICSVFWRVNLPLALLTTLYTNPFTIVPLYLVAFTLGQFVMGDPANRFSAPPELVGADMAGWITALADWMLGLGSPLALGLVLLGTGLAVTGYFAVRLAWRISLIRRWRRRGTRRRQTNRP